MSRLIDAERFEHIGFQTRCEKRYDDGFSDGVMFVAQKIDDAPTIDAIPVEWLEEKLINHPELSYVVTDGINAILEMWQKEQEAQDGDTK